VPNVLPLAAAPPAAAPSLAPAAPATSATTVPIAVAETVAPTTGAPTEPCAEPVGTATPSRPLPPGWEVRVNCTTGHDYYVDHNTESTHWVAPAAPAEPATTVAPSEPAEPVASTTPAQQLPPGWEVRVNSTTGRDYFVDHNMKSTHWELPQPTTAGPETSAAPIVPVKTNSPETTLAPATEASSAPAAAPSAPATVAPVAPEGPAQQLPPGWEQRVNSTGRPFYVNHTTRSTQWEPPVVVAPAMTAEPTTTVAPATTMQPLPAGWEKMVNNTGRDFYVDHNKRSTQWDPPETTLASATEAPSAPAAAPSAPATVAPVAPEGPAQQLPPGWEMRVNSTGRDFYVDHNTRSTHWDPPETTLAPATEAPVVEAELDIASQQLPAGWEMPAPSATFNAEPLSDTTSTQTATSPPIEEVPAQPMPSGWEQSINSTTGRTYYIDHNTQSTQWDPPTIATTATSPPAGEVPAQQLPSGWERSIDSTTGRTYYIDHSTQSTQWDPPTITSTATSPPEGEGPAQQLPPGWDTGINSTTGRRYYIDHNSQSTQWDSPTILIGAPVAPATPPVSAPSTRVTGMSLMNPLVDADAATPVD